MTDQERLKRPRVLTRCPANAHTGAGERIIEFSFPGRGTAGSVAGGLISFRDLGPERPPRVEVYRTDGEVTVISPKVTYWAAYFGMARYGTNDLSLYTSERAALEAIAEGVEVPLNDPDDPQQVRDNSELRDALGEVDGLEWQVQEVDTP